MVQDKPMVTLVDLTDLEQGSCPKEQAHGDGLLHRAFSVFIIYQNQMLLQQRHMDKYHCGGLWTNACCSHPEPGEIVADAAKRRLKQELGLNAPDLEKLMEFPYFYEFNPNLYEYEYDHVFLWKLPKSLPIKEIIFNQEEVQQLAWVNFSDLLQDIQANPKKYTPWFIISAPLVIKFLQKI